MKKKKSKILLIILLILCMLAEYTACNRYIFCGNDKQIALTFDDGPSDYTDELLDGLEAYGAKASFFILGKKINEYTEVIKRIDAEGHLIGNHTWSHKNLFEISSEEFTKELNATDDALYEVIGKRTVYFRPPHGWYLPNQLNVIDKVTVVWSKDPADWKYENEEYVYTYIKTMAQDGAIILLHDTKKTTVQGVLKAIPELKKQGYSFARVDELLCRNGKEPRFHKAYRCFPSICP